MIQPVTPGKTLIEQIDSYCSDFYRIAASPLGRLTPTGAGLRVECFSGFGTIEGSPPTAADFESSILGHRSSERFKIFRTGEGWRIPED